MTFLIGLIVGVFLGAMAGVFIMCLVFVSRENQTEGG